MNFDPSTLLILAAEQGEQLDIWELILSSRGVVAGVLIGLVLMSLISWYIIGTKLLYLRKARRESNTFLDLFWKEKNLTRLLKKADELPSSPEGQVFKAGYIELSKLKGQSAASESTEQGTDDATQPDAPMAKGAATSGKLTGIENVERALRRAVASETTHLERLTPFLATTGATAPFIGLFGTVWGILKAFLVLDDVSAAQGISVVAEPIAEALVATAIGLVAAIPSVMAYNYFIQRIKVITTEMDNFAIDFLNIAKRHFFE